MGALSGGIPFASSCRLGLAAGALCVGFLPPQAGAGLVINEFLPDPAGSDGGREFVELLNTGPAPVDLDRVALQFANGAIGAQWATRWSGTGHGTLAAGARFLLADRNWQGLEQPDVEIYLGLQNGPDAIRLVDAGVVLDLVGYGPLTDPELFEGAPAGLTSGMSLARRPDGRDTQQNAADFVSAQPTPGAANFQPFAATATDLDLDPPFLEQPGGTMRLSVTVRNEGTETLSAGPCRLAWIGGEVASWWDNTGPDDSRTLTFVAHLDRRGPIALSWELPLPGGQDTLRVLLGTVQVGAAALQINEVMPAPLAGQGEWLEFQWRGGQSADLADFEVRDEDGSWLALPQCALTTGSLVVVAQDSVGLSQWQQANGEAGGGICPSQAVVLAAVGWPSLNNLPPAGRLFADRVLLRDSLGTVIDAVAWGGTRHELPERDLSLERIGPEPINPGAANWTVCTAQVGSTPGCPNSVTAREESAVDIGVLEISPPLLDRGSGPGAVHLRFVLVAPEISWELLLFSLWGDLVRDFGGDSRGAGPRDLVWDGRDDQGDPASPGAYIVWLETRSAAAGVERRLKSRLVVR